MKTKRDSNKLLRLIVKYLLLCKLDGLGYTTEYETFLYKCLFYIY